MEKKTNKKALGVIIAIIVVLLIVAIVGGIFIFKNSNSTGTEWGDLYLRQLEMDSKEQTIYISTEDKSEEKKIEMYKNSHNTKISFIEVDPTIEPVMLVSYESENGKKSLNVYSINTRSR